MIGPGKYDDICTLVRERAEALGAIVIIFERKHGHAGVKSDVDKSPFFVLYSFSVERAVKNLSAFERFQKVTKALVAVPKKELQGKLENYKKEKPKRQASKR